MLVVEKGEDAGNDDEEGPPSGEVDGVQTGQLQSPANAEGQDEDTTDDSTCVFHIGIVLVIII